MSVDVVRQLAAVDRGDPALDRWMGDALFGWLVEATLTWLDHGDPARDDDWLERATEGLRALREAWARS